MTSLGKTKYPVSVLGAIKGNLCSLFSLPVRELRSPTINRILVIVKDGKFRGCFWCDGDYVWINLTQDSKKKKNFLIHLLKMETIIIQKFYLAKNASSVVVSKSVKISH